MQWKLQLSDLAVSIRIGQEVTAADGNEWWLFNINILALIWRRLGG